MLQIPNSESNSRYIKLFCKAVNIPSHSARFLQQILLFFMNFLTEPGDIVLDIFTGSNTTDAAAEFAQRRWIAFEHNPSYLSAYTFRFIKE